MKEKAQRFIQLIIEEEESDLECCKIENGSYIDSDGENFNWKIERIEMLKYILKRLS